MSLTVRIFIALVLGLGGGIALAAFAPPETVAGIAAIALAVLMVRPQGLFGEKIIERI